MVRLLQLTFVLAAMMRLQYEAFDILLEANDHQFPDVSSSLQSVKDHIKEKKDEKPKILPPRPPILIGRPEPSDKDTMIEI